MIVLKRPLNPEAVLPTDQFIIARQMNNEWVAIESWQAKFIAQYYLKVIKQHEPEAVFKIFAADQVILA